MAFDVKEFRSHFPSLDQKVNGHPLVYFDSGASSLKPQQVADRLYNYYYLETANIHRGAHTLSRQGTEKFEQVRGKVAQFIQAAQPSEIIFTRGVTEAMNLLAYTLTLKKDDVILLSHYEHHSNIIPWKMLCERTGACIKLIPFDSNGQIDDIQLEQVLEPNVKMISIALYSNVTGVRFDVEKVIQKAKHKNIITILDAAQAMLHEAINVQKMGCDFLAFSGHKMLAPYGVGVLYGRKDLLDKMPPFQGGGSMISKVTWQNTIYQDAPYKFEAGTPSIADVLGLGTAIDFIQNYNLQDWNSHGKAIVSYLETELCQISKVKLIGSVSSIGRKADIVSFIYEGAHPSDVGEILDQLGIAVRAGHHCAQPLMDYLNISGTVRISLAPYNTLDEAKTFISAMKKVGEVL